MSTKSKFFSWGSISKNNNRQSTTPEPYYRTGGLLPIDTNGAIDNQLLAQHDADDTVWSPNQLDVSGFSQHYNTSRNPHPNDPNDVLIKSASNLLVFGDSLKQYTLNPSACIKPSDKPLLAPTSRYSLPPSPVLPAELPGSLLLENRGFLSPPSPAPDADAVSITSVSSIRSMFSLSAQSSTRKVPQHRKSANDLKMQRRSRSQQDLVASPSSTDSRITTCSAGSNNNVSSANTMKSRVGTDTLLQPAHVIVEGELWKSNVNDDASSLNERPGSASKSSSTTRNKQLDELKATITAQDQTISTLQSQFANLRVSHDAHASSLVKAHSLEISALKDYIKSLESQQRGLHHASSNHLLFMLDTTESKRDSPMASAGSTPAGSIRSLKAPRSPLRAKNAEMENLKKKLSLAKRPDVGNGDAVRELSLYKKSNEALQKQVESIMTKLNQSKEEERKQKQTIEELQKSCDEWKEKANDTERLHKSTMALQNTIDHLEYRLEVANVDKVEAEEQLFNIRSHRTPFEPKTPKLQVPDNRQSTRTSMSTVFANESPISQSDNEPAALAAFVSHIDRLQEQIRSKDAQITELEADNAQLQRDYNSLRNEHRELDLQSDIQSQLLVKTKQNDIHIEELRTAIIKREALIGEKSKALQQTERQLEHHKLLLEAEIRRHASFSLLSDTNGNPLPELTSLASKEDIDRWIERLQKQLSKDKAERTGKKAGDESTVASLRREIDFYIREIIYYKLDCRGYKSDIKKLKRIAAQMGAHGSRPDETETPEPSVGKSSEAPAPTKAVSTTSPIPGPARPISLSIPLTKRMTPPPSVLTPDASPVDNVVRTVLIKRIPKPLNFDMPLTPRTPPPGAALGDEADPGISPRSIPRLSPERRKPTPPSPNQEKFGDLATNFPLSTPAAPQRHHRRSLSDPIKQVSQSEMMGSVKPTIDRFEQIGAQSETRARSGSVPESPKSKRTPERPPRPRFGLFDHYLSDAASLRMQTPPRVDVMAEAMRNLQDQSEAAQKAVRRKPLNPSTLEKPMTTDTETETLSEDPPGESAMPAPLQIRSRQGSSSSGATVPPPSRTPSRRPSTAASSNIPFVIAMGSPHNPALLAAASPVSSTARSATAKFNAVPLTLRTGVGGTMASTTPVTSPTSPTAANKDSYFSAVLPASPSPLTGSKSAPPSRNASISSRRGFDLTSSFAAPTAASRSRSGHARNLSASSLRQAINLPARIDFIKGKGKSRKDSIGHPTPLASPFTLDRSA